MEGMVSARGIHNMSKTGLSCDNENTILHFETVFMPSGEVLPLGVLIRKHSDHIRLQRLALSNCVQPKLLLNLFKYPQEFLLTSTEERQRERRHQERRRMRRRCWRWRRTRMSRRRRFASPRQTTQFGFQMRLKCQMQLLSECQWPWRHHCFQKHQSRQHHREQQSSKGQQR